MARLVWSCKETSKASGSLTARGMMTGIKLQQPALSIFWLFAAQGLVDGIIFPGICIYSQQTDLLQQ